MMKKQILLTLATLCCAMAMTATTYTGHLRVVVNDEVTEQEQVPVLVTQDESGLYTLSLNNFVLVSGDVTLPVGNIQITGVEGVDAYGYTTITYNDAVTITAGDDPAYGEDEWLGPMLGSVVIDMASRFTADALNATIDIDLTAMLGQKINVTLFGVAPVLKGDVTNDGEVSISDVNAVVDIITGD